MAVNFEFPLYYPSERPLVEEVVGWLRTAPEFNDVVYYVSKLPEDLQEPVAYQVATLGSERLFEEKQAYFTAGQWEAFLANLSEDDQLFYLSAFSKYAPASVMQNLVKEVPALAGVAVPADITAWSRSFTKAIYSYMYMGIVPDYQIIRYYATSISRVQNERASLLLLSEEVAELLANIQSRFQRGSSPSQEDRQQEAALLAKVGFIPSDAQQTMLDGGDTPEKIDFFQALHTAALAVYRVRDLGVEEAELQSEVESLITFMLVEQASKALVVKFASLRSREDPKAMPATIPALVERIANLWDLQAIRSGQVVSNLNALYTALDPQQKVVLNILLYKQMRQEAIIEILIEPFLIDQVLTRLQEIHDEATLLQYISDCDDILEDPGGKDDFSKLIRAMHGVISLVGSEVRNVDAIATAPPTYQQVTAIPNV